MSAPASLGQQLAAALGGTAQAWAAKLGRLGLPSALRWDELGIAERARVLALMRHVQPRLAPVVAPRPNDLESWAWLTLRAYLERWEPWRLVPRERARQRFERCRRAVADELPVARGARPFVAPVPPVPWAAAGLSDIPQAAEQLGLQAEARVAWAVLRAAARCPRFRSALVDLAPFARGGALPVRLVVRLARPDGPAVATPLLLPDSVAPHHRAHGVDYWRLGAESIADPGSAGGSGPAPPPATERPGAGHGPRLPGIGGSEGSRAAGELDSVLRRLAAPAPADAPLVLAAETEDALEHVVLRQRHRDAVLPLMRHRTSPGLFVLLAGEDEDVKLRALQALMPRLEATGYAVRAAMLLSRYIGETEQRISRLFACARGLDAALVFEDAQDLLAPRNEVHTSNDRHANRVRNHLLQTLDAHAGLCFFAAPGMSAFDAAVQRRLTVTVPFPAPDESRRLRIARATLAWLAERCERLCLTRDTDVLLAELAARLDTTRAVERAVTHAAIRTLDGLSLDAAIEERLDRLL